MSEPTPINYQTIRDRVVKATNTSLPLLLDRCEELEKENATLRTRNEQLEAVRPLAVEALNELQAMRKQIVHGGGWCRKIDDLFERARKALQSDAGKAELPANLLDVHTICDQRDKAVQERDDLRAKLAEALPDKARMDWLENEPTGSHIYLDRNLRKNIDAAMAQKEQP